MFRLRALGHPLQQAFERYYIAISVLAKNGPGALGAAELESLCHLAAQRLSLLYAPAAPEFFDKTLCRRNHINEHAVSRVSNCGVPTAAYDAIAVKSH